MKHGVILTVGIGSAVFIRLFDLARGYFADPALPLLGIPLPFLAVALALITVLVSVSYCVWLIFVRRTRRNIRLTLAALIGPLVLVAGPRLLNSHDAFVYRMESFSEAEYQRLAADIKKGFDERGIDEMSYDIQREELRAITESLVDSHSVLAISEFPLDIGASDERVFLEWASGLTGGYKLMISLRPDPPSEWAGPPGPGLPGPYNILEVTYIYDGVALLHLP